MSNVSECLQCYLLGVSIPNSLRFSSSVFVACLTSTASSITRFMNSSKPCADLLAYSTPKLHCRFYTLILPSIRIASCSNNHIDTVERCCRSLKMKLIGGKRTFPLPPPPPPPRPVIVRSVDFASKSRDEEYLKMDWSIFSGDIQSRKCFHDCTLKFSACIRMRKEGTDSGRTLIRWSGNEQSNC